MPGRCRSRLPLGTGNLLAANLELPSGLDTVELAITGRVRRIDVAEVNGESFAVMAGSGLDALMIGDANATAKRRFGSLACTTREFRGRHLFLIAFGVWLLGFTSVLLLGTSVQQRAVSALSSFFACLLAGDRVGCSRRGGR